MSTTAWWVVGSIVGAAVVLVAAGLLLTAIALVRRINRQAAEISAALEGARSNTAPLHDVAKGNHLLEAITRGLERLRTPGEPADERGPLARIADRVLPGRGE